MSEFREKAIHHMKEHWNAGMAGSADAAYLLGINMNTFKTRLARGQALVLREADGGLRANLTFTGYHLVYNLLSDRLLRYGFTLEGENTLATIPHAYAEWCLNNVLSPPYHTDAILQFRKLSDGSFHDDVFEDGNVEQWTGDAAMIIPIGTMIVRLSVSLYSRSGKDPVLNAMIAHTAPMSDV